MVCQVWGVGSHRHQFERKIHGVGYHRNRLLPVFSQKSNFLDFPQHFLAKLNLFRYRQSKDIQVLIMLSQLLEVGSHRNQFEGKIVGMGIHRNPLFPKSPKSLKFSKWPKNDFFGKISQPDLDTPKKNILTTFLSRNGPLGGSQHSRKVVAPFCAKTPYLFFFFFFFDRYLYRDGLAKEIRVLILV